MDILDTQLYSIIGEKGFTRLVRAFYAQVPEDDILGKMYPPEDLTGAEERLRGFLIQRFAGPMTYSQQRGHPRLRMRHSPFRVDHAARDRWMTLMDGALQQAAFSPEITAMLHDFFGGVATFMINS